jgi:hypothetical protein
MRLRVDARRLQTAANKLNTGAKRLQSSRHALALSIAQTLKEIAERRIRVDKTDPDGVPWKPWSDSYAATRRGGHSLLIDTHALLEGFTATASPAGNVAEVANRVGYAGFVQKQRPFLGIGAEERDVIGHLSKSWLSRILS